MSTPSKADFNPFDLTPFHEGLAAGKLLLPVSAVTGRWLCPGDTSENGALLRGVEWKEPSGLGSIDSFVVYRRAYRPDLETRIPYVVALVRLAEGPRMIGRIEGMDPAILKVGMPVTATVSRDGPEPLLCFRLSGGATR